MKQTTGDDLKFFNFYMF